MISRVSTASSVEDSTVVQRAQAAIAAAAGHLGLPPPDLAPCALGRQLDDLGQRLEQRIASSPDPTDAAIALLISILRLRCQLLDHDQSRRVRCLSEIRNALGSLRGLSPRDMIYAAPVVLSRELGFARTMVSTVRGSVWMPQHLHIEDEGADPHSRRFLEYVHGAHIHLADAPLETELVRKRCGALVVSPAQDKRTFKEIVEVSGCFGYIAAPITVQGRAIGMLHADRPEPHGMVTMDHLDQLEAFAECLSVAFESAVLEEKALQMRRTLGNMCADVDAMLSRTGQSLAGSSAGIPRRQPHAVYYRREQSAFSSLTAREREILSHVATGATNSQIARCLVISEGTVKSHLKHIAKKLNTSSRAAAVAVYAGVGARSVGGAA
jgi:DNA-binding CsgD family transcriptional regulator/GAF domain-containing protein